MGSESKAEQLTVWIDPAYEFVSSPLTGGVIIKLKDPDGWRAYLIPHHEIVRFAGYALHYCSPAPASAPAASAEPAAASSD